MTSIFYKFYYFERAIYKLDKERIIFFVIDKSIYPNVVESFSVTKIDKISLGAYEDSIKLNLAGAIRLLRNFINYNLCKDKPLNDTTLRRIKYAKKLKDKLIKESIYSNLKNEIFTEFYYPVIYDDVISTSSLNRIVDAYNDYIQSEIF